MRFIKVYPQIFHGKYHQIKNCVNYLLLLVYFGASWIPWYRGEGMTNQALFIDLPKRRAYFFSIEIWPDEVYYITAILILAALGLFIFTSVFGRLWCGYTCPQTVFTDIFIKIETFFQGDRNARIALDAQPLSGNKLLRKSLTYISWLGMSFLFAAGWACYFYGARELFSDLLHGTVSANGTTWLLYLTATTYLFAGIMRERVCTYFCPYGRFQSAMFDKWTTLVTYHDWRGEPRSYKIDKDKQGSEAKVGDCIDCGRCVHACPMGIDIREGLQMKCIGCGLCIDACDSVMTKLKRPLGLIAYDSIISTDLKKQGITPRINLLRPKIVAYSLVMIVASSIMLYSLTHKSSYRILVDRERSPLFIHTMNDDIRNIYNISILNRTVQTKNLSLRITSELSGLQFAIQRGSEPNYGSSVDLEIRREEEISARIIAQVPNHQAKGGSIPINFELCEEGKTIAKKTTIFMLPEQ